jgi:hypothetical protein
MSGCGAPQFREYVDHSDVGHDETNEEYLAKNRQVTRKPLLDTWAVVDSYRIPDWAMRRG